VVTTVSNRFDAHESNPFLHTYQAVEKVSWDLEHDGWLGV